MRKKSKLTFWLYIGFFGIYLLFLIINLSLNLITAPMIIPVWLPYAHFPFAATCVILQVVFCVMFFKENYSKQTKVKFTISISCFTAAILTSSIPLFLYWVQTRTAQIILATNKAVLIIIPILFLISAIVVGIFVIPRRPTKAERLEAKIDELQKQVDELKKGE